MRSIQYQSLVLPFPYATIAAAETVADAVTHVGLEFRARYLQEKTINIMAMEIVAAVAPGPLTVWIELSPYPTLNNLEAPAPNVATGVYWAAIGGGGGALAPTAPLTIVGTGVNATIHTELMAWTMHSEWARVIVQTPIPVAGESWAVQVYLTGKSF